MATPSRRSFMLGAASVGFQGPAASSARAGSARVIKAVMHTTLGVLDPFATISYINRNHGYLVYDTLFALDADNRPQPQMVGSWNVSDDALTYTFTLRPELRFHDGVPVTAGDVVASLRRWMPRDVLGRRLASVLERLEAVDGAVFRLVLKRRFGMVLEALAKPSSPVPFILPRRLVEIPETAIITEVVGSGPFRFVAAEHRSGDRVVYERFADYVPRAEPASGLSGGKVAKVDRVEWLEIGDPQTAVNALITGEVQVVENIPADMMALLRRTHDVVLKPRRFGNTMMLRFNSAQAPFDNPLIRRAVMMAVRQQDYLDAQIGDAALSHPCTSILSCDSRWVAECPGPGGDLVQARAMLAASGYAGETVVLLHANDLPAVSAIAPVTEPLLRAIGMTVRMETMDWMGSLARRTRDVPVSQGGWSVAPSVLSNMDLMNPLVNPYLNATGPQGYPGWGIDPEIVRLRDAFASETDAGRQQEIATALQLRYDADAFSIPLGGHKVVTGHRSSLRGVVADQVLVFWGMEQVGS